MAKPTSKAELKEYCLRRLGKPVLEINVSDDQIDDAIDYTIQKFQQFHYDGCEKVYLKHLLTQDVVDRAKTNTNSTSDGGNDIWAEANGYIEMPEHILSVEGLFGFTDKGTRNMFDIRYQMRLNDLYDFSSTSVVHYEMTMQHLDLLDHILIGETAIRHNQHQNRLYLDADFKTDYVDGDYIVIECYRKLDPATFTDVWDDIFLKKYATQLIKMQWGANLSKFQGIQMLGGVALNGEQIYTQAQEQIDKLEEQIQLAYELPPMHMIG